MESGLLPADFFPSPAEVVAESGLFSDYLVEAGVDPVGRTAMLRDLEWWSRSYALATLEKLGWERRVGEMVNADELREGLGVSAEHGRLFRRLLEMLAQCGVVEEKDGEFIVILGLGDRLPEELPEEPEEFHKRMEETYPHGLIETGVVPPVRCGAGRRASRQRGPADAAVQQWRSHSSRPLPQGSRCTRRESDADRGISEAGLAAAPRQAASGH